MQTNPQSRKQRTDALIDYRTAHPLCRQAADLVLLCLLSLGLLLTPAWAQINYTFDDGTFQGWITVSSDPGNTPGPTHFEVNNTYTAQGGSGKCVWVDHNGSRDEAHQTLWIRSPQFKITQPGNLTFWLLSGTGNGGWPGDQAIMPANASEIPLGVDSTSSGVMGVALRDTVTGNFVRTGQRSISDWAAWEQISWDVSDLVDNGTVYTLEFFDYLSGKAYSSIGLDTISIPGTLESVETTTISGRVTESSMGVPNVVVTTLPGGLTGTTDANGDYTINNVTIGETYTLKASSLPAGKIVDTAPAPFVAVATANPSKDFTIKDKPPTALLVHYKFAGNGDDSSGNGKTGMLQGAATYGTGHLGTGSLDTTAGNGAFSVPELGTAPTTEYEAFTLCAWLKPTENFGWQALYQAPGWETHDTHIVMVYSGSEAHILSAVNQGGDNDWWEDNKRSAWAHPSWHHQAVVYDSVAKTTKFYFDGVLVNTVTKATATTAIFQANAYIGSSSGNINDRPFRGEISDFRIYDGVLTGDQILGLLTPAITGAATAAPFVTVYGTPSPAQSFPVSGLYLRGDLVATAPTGLEVSTDGITYGSTVSFTQTSGQAGGTLYIRLSATAPVGTYDSQTVVLSSTDAENVYITTSATGNVVSAGPIPVITTTGALEPLSTLGGVASLPTSFTVSGADMNAGITITPPGGLEISTTSATTGFAGSGMPITIGAAGTIPATTVYVRLAATAPIGTYNSLNLVLTSTGAMTVNVPTSASGNVVQARITYDFDDGTLQGWTTVSESPGYAPAPEAYAAAQAQAGVNPQTGLYFVMCQPSGSRDGAHQTLWIRSPQFVIDQPGRLTFWLAGGTGLGGWPGNLATLPVNASEIPLGVDSTTSGMMGVALRDTATGDFVLTAQRPAPSDASWAQVSWDVSPYLNNGKTYTLELFDYHSGNAWSFLCLDSVAIPGSLATTPTTPEFPVSGFRMVEGVPTFSIPNTIADKTYTLWFTDSLAGTPVWTPLTGTGTMFSPGGTIELSDTSEARPAERFYKLAVE